MRLDPEAHQPERVSMPKGMGAVFTLKFDAGSLKASGDQSVKAGAAVKRLMRGFDANENLACRRLRPSLA